MVKFNPDTNVDPGREYDFKGAMPNMAGEVALKGSANAVGNFVDAMHTAVTTDINERARAGEEQIQDNLFQTADLAAAQSSTTTAGVAQPEELARGVGKMQRLKNAYAKGAITESDYLSSIDVLAKSLRHRYGDKWANEIDSAVAGAVSNSANAYRRQLFNEWDASKTKAEKAAEDEDKARKQFFKENHQYLYRRPEWFGGPLPSVAEMAVEVNKIKVPEDEVKRRNAEFTLLENQNKATDKDRLGNAKLNVSHMLRTVVDQSGASVNNKLMEMIQAAQADGSVNQDEKKNMLAYVSRAKPHIQQSINQLILDRYADMKESDKQEIVAMGDSVIKMYEDMLFHDKTGLFAATTNLRAWAAEDAMSKAMKENPDFADTVAFKDLLDKAGLTDYANKVAGDFLIRNPDGSTLPGFRRLGNLLVGKNDLDEYMRAAYETGEDGTKVLETFKLLRDAVTSEETGTLAKQQAAAVLFNPEKSQFLTEGMVDGKMAVRLYNEMTTGDMVATMSAMKGTDMVTWDNYYNWVMDPGFKAVFQYELNTLLPGADKVNFKFDSDRMEFTSKPSSDLKAVGGRAGTGYAAPTKETEHFVKRLNAWIKKVTPIMEANKDDLVFELNRVFEANGLREPVAGSDPRKMTPMQAAYTALVKEKEKQEAEEAATAIPE